MSARPLRGINLGNWLVLEKWMSPRLFDDVEADDEYWLVHDLDESALRERMKVHRDSYITERDIVYLAARGFELLRIPVPYFVFGDRAPFLGCIEHLDRAFAWAERHGMRILLDLHTVPGSQNGFDNGGLSGVCAWHRHPAEVEFAITVLERLAARYAGRAALWGVEVLNEPVSREVWTLVEQSAMYPPRDPQMAAGSEPVPTSFLEGFYRDSYARIRQQCGEVTVVFHDGFRLGELSDFFAGSGFTNFMVDTHSYLMLHTFVAGGDTLAGYLGFVEREAANAEQLGHRFPMMIGEWCLNTRTVADAELSAAERVPYYRALADAQLAAWQRFDAWCFWSYKLLVDEPGLDGWDLGRSIELGYFPAALGSDTAERRGSGVNAGRPVGE